MSLFENEIINITKIRTVNIYNSEAQSGGITKHYGVDLPCYELIFFLSGDGICHFSGVEMSDRDDSLRFLPKGKNDGEYYVTSQASSKCIDIYFDTADEMPKDAMCIKNIKELRPLFLKIHSIWNSKSPGYYARSMSVFYEIIEKIKNHNDIYQTQSQEQKILPAQKYAAEHFCDPQFDYRAMCETTGLSYNYFKSLFIKKHSESPIRYVTRLKLEKATELLITGRYSIGEIAEMCGFENVYYFSTVFKKHFGVSPSKYKEH